MYARIITIFALAILLICESQATIRRVAKDGDGTVVYNNIQAAINDCLPGDTVIVSGNMGPWSPSGSLLTIDRRIIMLGQGNGCDGGSGPGTEIRARLYFTAPSDGAMAKGLFLSNSCPQVELASGAADVFLSNCRLRTGGGSSNNCVRLSANCSVTIDRCVLVGYNEQCVNLIGSQSSAVIRNSVLTTYYSGTYGSGVRPHTDATSSFWISNCLFVDLAIPIADGIANWYLDHNIFWDNGNWNGTVSGPVTASYNAMDNAAYANFPGTNKINLQGVNPFVAYDGEFTECAEDFHLHAVNGAALIDGGDPNAPNDRDGSRRDLGIYGGPTPFVDTGAPDFPFVTNFFVPSSVPSNGVLEIRSTGRVGPGGAQ